MVPFHGQLFSVIDFLKLILDMLINIGKMRQLKKLDEQFRERIMLAVTMVNECIYCENYHKKVAIHSGISRQELDFMLNNEFTSAPKEQLTALLFAQEYARNKGLLSIDTLEQFEKYYENPSGILSAIRTIMIGNSYGVVLYGLRLRLSLKRLEGSRFINEIGIFLSPLFLPLYLLYLPLEYLRGHRMFGVRIRGK